MSSDSDLSEVEPFIVVLAVEIDEPTTKKIRECRAKETQFLFSLILVIIVSCLIFPIINIFNFFFFFMKS